MVPSRGSGTTPTVRSPVPPAKVTPPPKADDTPVAPSPEFMKWLNDSLKQLNSSVNCLFIYLDYKDSRPLITISVFR